MLPYQFLGDRMYREYAILLSRNGILQWGRHRLFWNEKKTPLYKLNLGDFFLLQTDQFDLLRPV